MLYPATYFTRSTPGSRRSESQMFRSISVAHFEQFTPPVVGQLIEDPGAFQHIERVNLIDVEAVLKRGAVLSDLYHLASVIFPLIKSEPVRASLAHPEVERGEKQTMK